MTTKAKCELNDKTDHDLFLLNKSVLIEMALDGDIKRYSRLVNGFLDIDDNDDRFDIPWHLVLAGALDMLSRNKDATDDEIIQAMHNASFVNNQNIVCISNYQKQAARTLISSPGFEIPDRDQMAAWCALGLTGEAGEVAENIKKGVYHRHGIDIGKLKEELGDVLWYIAGLCTTLDIDMSEVMSMNIDKLMVRYPNGFNSEDSQKRVDKQSDKSS